MDAEGHEETKADPGAGVFGNLPTSRPGTRSPRRRSSAAAEEPAADKPNPEAPALDPIADAERVAAATAPRRPAAKTEPTPDPATLGREAEEADGGDSSDGGGIQDLAWAGVAVAADAATIGVRLASRALERLRDGVDPR